MRYILGNINCSMTTKSKWRHRGPSIFYKYCRQSGRHRRPNNSETDFVTLSISDSRVEGDVRALYPCSFYVLYIYIYVSVSLPHWQMATFYIYIDTHKIFSFFFFFFSVSNCFVVVSIKNDDDRHPWQRNILSIVYWHTNGLSDPIEIYSFLYASYPVAYLHFDKFNAPICDTRNY